MLGDCVVPLWLDPRDIYKALHVRLGTDTRLALTGSQSLLSTFALIFQCARRFG